MPYFGGKSRAAEAVWQALGDVDSYVEPFGGSLALLLGRPDHHRPRVETVNDADGLLINWWRAVAADPEAVARWADWPVSELDLTSRHFWLVERRAEITARLEADPTWFDAQAAGWWVWGACSWIGSGWCSGEGPWVVVDGEVINRKLPHLGNAGMGINRQLPHLGNAGMGINRQLPHLGNAGRGEGLPAVYEWFDRIAARLRRVRITCGSWDRVVSPAVLERHGTAGIVLDPPYPDGWDTDGAYAGQQGVSAHDICRDVFASAIEMAERGVRVVVCGYRGTWEPPADWTVRSWTARKGYGDQKNSQREVLWCSPACISAEQLGLFTAGRP